MDQRHPRSAARGLRRGAATALLGLLFLLPPLRAQAPPADVYDYFRQNCASCHTIGGGRLTGPDLKGLLERTDRAWLRRFLPDPKALIDSGDPRAVQLFTEARGTYMATIPGLTAARIEALIDLIEYESSLEKSAFAGMRLSQRPLTEVDVQLGREVFSGRRRLANGGPPCISCHSTASVGGLGGGRLGPDLSTAYARLEGRKALSAWLVSPPSVVMAPVFKNRPLEEDEILGLVAFLRSEAQAAGVETPDPGPVDVLMAGGGLAALVLAAFDFFWRRRYRATRRPLLDAAAR